MNINPIYKKKFEQMLGVEEQARNLYKYHANRIKDPTLLEKFQEIYKDEEKHIKIVQSFIEKLNK